MIGKTLGRYEILGKLGEGGMASVYWARDPKLNRQVAVKILPPWCKNDAGHLGRFKREVRLLADLSHPNIVSIFDFGEADEYVFYAMEFLSGGSLADEIGRRGRMDYKSTLRLASEIAGALDCIHRLGICHRDLKPHNILKSETGQHKLADFGLGKGEEFETITRAGELIGTLRYLPPEGLEGEPLDHTADLFQLGLVLYEAACGARPFRGSNAVEILRSYSKDTPPNPSACCPDVPPAFDNFVWNLVQMKRKDRYTDISAVLADLARLERGGNVRRRQPTIRPPARDVTAAAVAKASMPIKVPPPKPRQGLPPRVLAAMGLVVLMLLLLLRPGRFRSQPATPDVPSDIAVRVGERKALVTWKTREASRGVVEYGTKSSEVLMVAEEQSPATTHTVAILDLEPGREYTISLRGPEGVKALQRSVTPHPFTVELIRAEAEGGQGLIEWKSSQPARAVALVRRYDATQRLPVNEEPASAHLLRFEGIGPGVGFALSVEAVNDVDEKVLLDVVSLVDAAMGPLLPPPRDETLGAMNAKALKWLADPERKMLVAARSILENHEWRRALITKLPTLGFFLGNPQYPLEARAKVYRAIRLFQALEGQSPHLEALVATGLTAALPVSWMQTDTAALRQADVIKLDVKGDETLVADPSYVPLSRSGPPVLLSKALTVTLPTATATWAAAELRLSGRLQQGTLIDVDVNGRASLVLLPTSTESAVETSIVQRVPVELLKAGQNKITLSLRPMPGNAKTRALSAVFTAGELALEKGAESPPEIRITTQRGGSRK